MARELKNGQLTRKDMGALRETLSVRQQYKRTTGVVKDYGLNHSIGMTWGLEDSRSGLLPFILIIDGSRFTLSWGELKDLDRAGFFRREDGQPKRVRLHYLSGPELTLDTDLNDEAERDMIVRLTGEGIEAYVDWYEVLRLGRLI